LASRRFLRDSLSGVSANLKDKAEARRAASAQAAFPSRRAREKTVPEKVVQVLAPAVAIRSPS